MYKLFRLCSILLFAMFLLATTNAQQLAFPGAEGYGRFTKGGRGGSVYEVTNLNDSGPGSLRYGIEQYYYARTIVFRVSGTIILKSKLDIIHPNLTIAGQTAPGDGICIRDYPVYLEADNVIVRYVRFRLGDVNRLAEDSFSGKDHRNIIVDHCSMSWAIDENASWYDNVNFTMQWCIISESLYHSYHPKGNHGYGGIWGGWGATFHHNLIADNSSRNPRFNGSRYTNQPDSEIVDFVDNVIFNWGFNSAYGGEAGNQNIRNNYYKYGPATKSSVRNRIVDPSDTAGNWYIHGNYVYGYPDVTADNSIGVQGSNSYWQKQKLASKPFPIAPVDTQSAEEAYNLVLKNAGANFPIRDSVDARVVEQTKTGVATTGSSFNGGHNGIIDSQNDVGGWPVLNSTTAPKDSDHDGIPDSYESAHGLNPQDSTDGSAINNTGYSNLEVYINSLITNSPTAVNNEASTPRTFKLYNNFPNPFNPSTMIKYSIPNSAVVSLNIYDALGRKVSELVNKYQDAGTYSISWNALNSKVNSGVYFARLTAGKYSQTIKLLLLK